ncbi:phosphotransferase [Actinopolymorpha sp. B9G3]|uniref:phosphotransferase n=1 Tax=Actinopolymorpha sp. B9G3 TaxID=3158970 RepID=UPI0032D8D8E0
MILDDLDRLPLVVSHGDALPRNMLRREQEHVLEVDWAQLGYNTVGSDLASLYLYSSTEIDNLVRAYVDGLAGAQQIDGRLVRYATIRVAALIAVLRASRAVAAEHGIDGYIGRLIRAELLLAEVSR